MKIPDNYYNERDAVLGIVDKIDGRLTLKEMQFLFMLGTIRTAEGELLEIGSFKGKSTVLLSCAAKLTGSSRIYACDPLTQPSETDPVVSYKGTRHEFYDNIEQHTKGVEFFEMPSQELAKKWNHPLRMLWIDGDHTFKGAQSDFLGFSDYLQEGGIIAFHDVLNGFTGPLQVFTNEVLQDKRFGACGIVGSIAWSQFLGSRPNRHLQEKERLYIQLTGLLPHLAKRDRNRIDKLRFKLKRTLIPHNLLTAEEWVGKLDKA